MTLSVVVLVAVIAFFYRRCLRVAGGKVEVRRAGRAERALERELATAQATLQRQVADIQALAAAKSALDATLASERRNADEKLRLLADASEQLKIAVQGAGGVGAGQQQRQLSAAGQQRFAELSDAGRRRAGSEGAGGQEPGRADRAIAGRNESADPGAGADAQPSLRQRSRRKSHRCSIRRKLCRPRPAIW